MLYRVSDSEREKEGGRYTERLFGDFIIQLEALYNNNNNNNNSEYVISAPVAAQLLACQKSITFKYTLVPTNILTNKKNNKGTLYTIVNVT